MTSKYLTISLGILIFFPSTEGQKCNELLCSSAVSKCMLTQSCKCEMEMERKSYNQCCNNCAKCLGIYYERCCSCLDMCDTPTLHLDRIDSQVGNIPDPFVEFFIAMTSEEELTIDGVSFTYPVELPIEQITKSAKDKSSYQKSPNEIPSLETTPRSGLECTVVFMSECTSAGKCKEKCHNIGAVSFRYFLNGCCECIGPFCLNYGIKEPRCPKCPDFNDNNNYDETEMSPKKREQSNDIEGDYKK